MVRDEASLQRLLEVEGIPERYYGPTTAECVDDSLTGRDLSRCVAKAKAARSKRHTHLLQCGRDARKKNSRLNAAATSEPAVSVWARRSQKEQQAERRRHLRARCLRARCRARCLRARCRACCLRARCYAPRAARRETGRLAARAARVGPAAAPAALQGEKERDTAAIRKRPLVSK